MNTTEFFNGTSTDSANSSCRNISCRGVDIIRAGYSDTIGRMISRIAIPTFILIGLFGNMLIFAIMRRVAIRRRTIPFYFACLAVSDSVVLLYTAIGWTHAYLLQQPLHTYMCKIGNYIFIVAIHCSTWILVTMTTHRFLYIYFPQKRKSWYSRKRAQVVCLILSITFFIIDLFFIFTSKSSGIHENMLSLCTVQAWAEHILYLLMVFNIVLHTLLPATILLIINVCIIYWLLKQPKLNSHQYSTLAANAKRVTMVLLLISTIFIISSMSMVSVYIIAFASGNNGHLNPIIFSVVEVIWLFNFSCNFYVSVGTSKDYRAELKKMLGCPGTVTPQSAAASNIVVG